MHHARPRQIRRKRRPVVELRVPVQILNCDDFFVTGPSTSPSSSSAWYGGWS
jgi:hypothetical protein